MVVGIDPSFSRTGICFAKGKYLSFASTSAESKGVYQLNITLTQSALIAKNVIELIKKVTLTPRVICQEYPVMASRSGSILAVIMANLHREIKLNFPKAHYYLVPPMAVNAFTKCKTKKQLTDYVKQIHPSFKGNHDEATAFIVAVLGNRIHKQTYKKTFYTL